MCTKTENNSINIDEIISFAYTETSFLIWIIYIYKDTKWLNCHTSFNLFVTKLSQRTQNRILLNFGNNLSFFCVSVWFNVIFYMTTKLEQLFLQKCQVAENWQIILLTLNGTQQPRKKMVMHDKNHTILISISILSLGGSTNGGGVEGVIFLMDEDGELLILRCLRMCRRVEATTTLQTTIMAMRIKLRKPNNTA